MPSSSLQEPFEDIWRLDFEYSHGKKAPGVSGGTKTQVTAASSNTGVKTQQVMARAKLAVNFLFNLFFFQMEPSVDIRKTKKVFVPKTVYFYLD